jgi:hypothetical protein
MRLLDGLGVLAFIAARHSTLQLRKCPLKGNVRRLDHAGGCCIYIHD